MAAAAAAKSLQACPTLCSPIDGSPPGSPVPGILQARTLEWVAISFSNACKWKLKVKSLSHVRLLATPWTAAYQTPPSMGYSRQEYWSGVPLPSLTRWKRMLQISVYTEVVKEESEICKFQHWRIVGAETLLENAWERQEGSRPGSGQAQVKIIPTREMSCSERIDTDKSW